MPVNDTTTNRGYQKPNIANTLADDVGRLRSALDAIDTDMASKAPTAGPTFTGVVAIAGGSAAAPSLAFTGDTNTGLYSPGTDQVAISTGGTERLRIDSEGRIGVGGQTGTDTAFALLGTARGTGTGNYGYRNLLTIPNTTTGTYIAYESTASTSAAAFTLGNLQHYTATQGTLGAGSTVTNQYGYIANGSLIDATNNYGFFSNIPSGTGRWNFYAGGTADSYFASNNFIFANGGTEKARVDSSGRLLVGTSTESGGALLQVNGDRIRVGSSKTPASASATGTAGEICWDASYIYVCTATNTWKRAAIASW